MFAQLVRTTTTRTPGVRSTAFSAIVSIEATESGSTSISLGQYTIPVGELGPLQRKPVIMTLVAVEDAGAVSVSVRFTADSEDINFGQFTVDYSPQVGDAYTIVTDGNTIELESEGLAVGNLEISVVFNYVDQ